MVGTLPGRTQGLGLVTEPLMADLRIGRVDYAQVNLWATLIGSLFAIGIGRLVDRFGTRGVLTTIAIALGMVVCAMAPWHRTSGCSPIALTLTRGLGQSALSVVSITMVGHWFVRKIDLAMAIYSIALSVGFMIAFPVVGAFVQFWGWRSAWLFIGVALIAGLAPLSWLLARRSPEAMGLRRRRRSAADQPAPARPARTRPTNSRPHLAASRRDAGLLAVLGRHRALRIGRVRHWPVQRVDSRGARLRSRRLLPDAGRHGHDRARRQLRRRLAGHAHVACRG